MVYVEIFRNIPPLLVIFFWYSACWRSCRSRVKLPFAVQLLSEQSRLFFPKPVLERRAVPRLVWTESGTWSSLSIAG